LSFTRKTGDEVDSRHGNVRTKYEALAMLHLLMKPKKFALIGLPGSGKSTFASKLGKRLGIPVHHLDRHMFEPDGKKRDKHEFIAIQQAILNEEAWVVEGCSFSTFEMRFAKADVFIYFHFSRLVCFMRLFKRVFNYKKDFGGLRAVTWEILQYTWNFDKEKRKRIEELQKKYPQTEFLIFRNQQDADLYLKSLV
jgi:adenylate kinase family enzyme